MVILKKKKKKGDKKGDITFGDCIRNEKRTFGDKSLSPKIHFALVCTSLGLNFIFE